MLAGALLPSSDAEADSHISARHDASGTAETPLRPMAVPGKPGKPEIIPFITGGGVFNAYFLVKWTHPSGGAANYYEIRDSGDTLSVAGISGSTPESRYLRDTTIKGGMNWTLKVRGSDYSDNDFGPWSDTTTAHASAATVAASSITSSGATLTVSNLPATWWYQGDQTGATCTKVANGTSSATITGLDAGTEYTYSVYYRSTCTEDSDKAAHWDVKATFTTATTPAKPTNLTATRGNASVSLSWTAGSDGGSAITKWQYAQKSDGNYGDWTDICVTSSDSTCPSKTSYTVSSLTNGTAYKFKVRAVNAVGDGAESSESASVTPAAVPAKPSAPTLTVGDQQLGVSWSAPADNGSDITDYDVQYSSDSGSTWTEWNSSNTSTTTSATITGLTNDTGYQVQVRATNGVGDSLWSDSATATPATTPAKPSAPTLTVGDQQLGVSWSAPADNGSDITDYDVQYSSDSGSTWTEWNSSNTSTTTSATITGLTNDTGYQVQVRATNGVGDSLWSDSATAMPANETLAASSVTHNSATLAISNYSGNWHYKANAAPDNTCKGPVSTTTKNLTGLSGNTSYTYKAYSDSSCNTELAAASAFLTKPGKPTKPTATAGAGSGKLTLSSSVTGGGTISKWQYRQKKETDNTFGDWQDISSTATSLSHTVTGLTDGTKYQFKVLAVNATGNSAASAASNAAAPANETLAASSVTHNSATLTIGNHSGNWYYKANAAPDASCSSTAVSTTTKNLTGLSGNTSYTYKAYSDSSCNTELASASAFLTKPGKPTKPTATAGARQRQAYHHCIGDGRGYAHGVEVRQIHGQLRLLEQHQLHRQIVELHRYGVDGRNELSVQGIGGERHRRRRSIGRIRSGGAGG